MNNRYMLQKSLALLFILLIAGWPSNTLAQNGWERMADMNMERAYFRSCLLENRIYIFDGEDKYYRALSSAEAYNISTNEWTSLGTMPGLVAGPHVCEANNMIYIIGGWHGESGVGTPSDLNYEYNPELDDYSVKKNCPSNTCNSPSCTLNNKVYICGSHTWSFPEKKVFKYDPVTDNWDRLPNMNFIHSLGDAVSLNNKIYLIGGATESGNEYYNVKGKSEMYDPETNSWTVLNDMPFPVANHVSVVHDNKILVFGGDSADFHLFYTTYGSNLIQEYDPLTDTWSVMEGMPFKRSAYTAQKAGDFIYIIGGLDKPEHKLKEVWRFELNYLKPTSINELFKSTTQIFTLHQNYPNPFIGSTQISYELREPGVVKLDIVNILGREITSLVNEMKNPGSHSFTWDTEGVAPGVYFCRLRVGNLEKVIKLIVQ